MPSAPGAAGVRVWEIMSPGRGHEWGDRCRRVLRIEGRTHAGPSAPSPRDAEGDMRPPLRDPARHREVGLHLAPSLPTPGVGHPCAAPIAPWPGGGALPVLIARLGDVRCGGRRHLPQTCPELSSAERDYRSQSRRRVAAIRLNSVRWAPMVADSLGPSFYCQPRGRGFKSRRARH